MNLELRNSATALFEPVQTAVDSLLVEDRADERSTARGTILDPTGTLRVWKGQGVRVRDDGGTIVFQGFAVHADHARLTEGGYRRITFDAADMHYLTDKRLVATAYETITAGDIVRDLIDRILGEEGITAGTIVDGPLIQQITFDYATASDAIERLARRSTFWWRVDETGVLDFAPPGIQVALLLTEGGDVLTTEDGSDLLGRYQIGGATVEGEAVITEPDLLRDTLRVHHDRDAYRNQQWVKGGRGRTSVQVENQAGDGEKRAFAVSFPIANEPVVEVDTGAGFQPVTVGVRGLQDDRDWLWSFNSPIVAQNPDTPPLGTTHSVRVTYTGLFDVVARVQDAARVEENEALEGGTGIVENVIWDRSANTNNAAFEAASQAITANARDVTTVTFAVRDPTGIDVGAVLDLDFADAGLQAPAFILAVERFTSGEDERAVITAITNEALAEAQVPTVGSWSTLWADLWRRANESAGDSGGEIDIVTQPFDFLREWEPADRPNMFLRPYPGAGVYPGADLVPAAAFEDRVRFVSWHETPADPEFGRRAVTVTETGVVLEAEDGSLLLTEDAAFLTVPWFLDEIITTTVLGTSDALGQVGAFGFWGGAATLASGSGTLFDVQEVSPAVTKTEAQVFQVRKTDRRWP